MEKKFEEMTKLEKFILNEKYIVECHEKAIALLEKHGGSFISICTLKDNIDKRQRFIANLELEATKPPKCHVCGATENVKESGFLYVCMDQTECAKRMNW